MDRAYFREEQRFRQPWMWVVVSPLLGRRALDTL